MNNMVRKKQKMYHALEYMQKLHNQGREYISPTEVGRHVGEIYGIIAHSSYGSPICKNLVNEGYAERDSSGKYQIIERLRNVDFLTLRIDLRQSS